MEGYAICKIDFPQVSWLNDVTWTDDIKKATIFLNLSEAKKRSREIPLLTDIVTVHNLPEINFNLFQAKEPKINSFSGRIQNLLKRSGLSSDEQISQIADEDLLKIKGIGQEAFYAIRAKLPYKGK